MTGGKRRKGREETSRKEGVSGLKLWVFRIITVVLSPLLFLLLIEFLLRLIGYGYPTQYLVKVDSKPYFTANDRFPYRFFPPSLVRSPILDIIQENKPSGQYRIFLLGGSAARGTPDPCFSVARFLEVLLQSRYQGLDFKVVNAAMTAINSHVVREIAKDLCALQPDCLVVYCGNNEVVGPYGPGTVFQRFSPSLFYVRASIFLRKLKLSEFLSDLAGHLGVGRGMTWRGLELFEKNKIPAWDPRLRFVYKAFERNLVSVCKEGIRKGAKVILCTVPVNLKDFAPFRSLHRENLKSSRLNRWQNEFARGKKLLKEGNVKGALAALQKALKLDDTYAELHYLLAKALMQAGRSKEAAFHFQKACDLDCLRFRADSRLNGIVRKIAKEFEGQSVYLADTAKAFSSQALGKLSVPGKEFFYEHVHLNVQGRYRLALSVAKLFGRLLTSKKQVKEKKRWLSLRECRQRLGLTKRQEFLMLKKILDMMRRPPFTERPFHSEEYGYLESQARVLERELGGREAALKDVSVFKKLLKAKPKDPLLNQKLVETLAEAGLYDDALKQLKALESLLPGIARWAVAKGRILRDSGRPEQARKAFLRAIELRPNSPEAYSACFELGDLMLEKKDLRSALRYFQKALEISPESHRAWARLGACFVEMGKEKEAWKAFERSVEVMPTYAAGYYNLAALCAMHGKLKEAEKLLRKSIRYNPELAEAHEALGRLLERKGRAEEARRHFLRARALRSSRR